MLVNDIKVLALDVDGVLTDGKVTLSPRGEEAKELCFRDLDAIARARRQGLQVALVTGEAGPMVEAIVQRIGVDQVISGAKDKLAAIAALSDLLGVPRSQICFVGDAERDALAFPSVGLALAPRDASRAALAKAHRVLQSAGGAGAAAEAVELVLSLSDGRRGAADRERSLKKIVEDSIASHQKLLEESLPALAEVAEVLTRALRSGHRVLFCGNGGSAADAQHVAAELVGRFAIEREPWPALALTTDTSILTAVGNDWDFKDVFARQVRAHARPGDVVVGISTSGRSPNIVRALDAARERGAFAIAFTGRNGGPIAKAADLAFRAPEAATPRIQELHILAWHGICEIVELALTADREMASTGS
ncbi:MAG TPA: SIS domain-containing protein [Polyangiaceae bacterium]|jgi:D-sedoheptulose 7-phosphate isomerase